MKKFVCLWKQIFKASSDLIQSKPRPGPKKGIFGLKSFARTYQMELLYGLHLLNNAVKSKLCIYNCYYLGFLGLWNWASYDVLMTKGFLYQKCLEKVLFFLLADLNTICQICWRKENFNLDKYNILFEKIQFVKVFFWMHLQMFCSSFAQIWPQFARKTLNSSG